MYWIVKPIFLKTSWSHEEKTPPCSPPEYLRAIFYIQMIKYLPSRNLDSLVDCWITYLIASGKLKMVLIQNFDIPMKDVFSVMQDVILYKENSIQEKPSFRWFTGLINLSLCLFDNGMHFHVRTYTQTLFLHVSYTIRMFGLDRYHWHLDT